MTSKDIFNKSFPQDKQIGGSHYKNFTIQPYEFISKNPVESKPKANPPMPENKSRTFSFHSIFQYINF